MKSADAYEKAYRDGQQCYKQRVLEGKDPYLPVLDTITEDNKIRKTSPGNSKRFPWTGSLELKQEAGQKLLRQTSCRS